MPRYVRNYERKGIEIYFERKPSEAVRDTMKANGWRWSGFNKCWYNFYSESNLLFAEELCGNNEKGLYEEIKENNSKQPREKKKIAEKKEPTENKKTFLSKGDRVVVTDEEGRQYAGVVSRYCDKSREAKVEYIVSSGILGNDTQEALFKLDKIKKQSRISPTSLFEDRVVSFITDEGIVKKGKIDYINSEENYDLKYYEVDSLGTITIHTIEYVSIERILEIEYGANIFPFHVGDKVEFESDEAGFTVGKISYINDDDSVDIEYEYIDSWGDKETATDYDVSLDDIHVMVRGKKALDKSVYITKEKQQSIDINEKIKERIKSRYDNFVDASHLVQNRSLYRHQKAGTMLADMYDKFAFFYDTGTGKTVMALDIIMSKQHSDNARFLIIAPKSIIKTAWMDDAAKYYPSLRILPLYKDFNAKRKRSLLNSWKNGGISANWESDPVFISHIKLISDVFDLGPIEIDSDIIVDETLSAEAKHYIINSELFIRDPDKYISGLGITGIVMDESAILKNYNGKTAKTMRKVAEQVKYVYLLSGKPAPNNIIEYFSQMKIVDPDTFSMSYDRFLNMFCYSANRKYYIRSENEKLFAEMVSVRSLIISKKDCLDLPDTVDVIRQIELPDDVMKDYNELYRECMTLIKGMDHSSVFYSAQSKLAVLMKLRQMASGFFMTGSGKRRERKLIIDIHNAKIKELNRVVDQIEEEQVIVWCQFQHEIEIVEQELSKRAYTVTAYGKTKDLEKNIDDFKSGRAQYIVAHPKTLKYGVTFVNCKYSIYYSFSYSAEDYDQSHDRNYRLGQTEMCTYIYLQAADTIDEIMHEKVMNKLSNSEFFEKLIKDAAKHGIDYDTLKHKSDDDIRRALAEDSGEIETLAKEITTRQYKSKRQKNDNDSKVFTTYDYLDKIDEPTIEELQLLEKTYVGKYDRLFLDGGPLEKWLYDNSRPAYFDFVHADERQMVFSKQMSELDFRIFLREQLEEDRWIYEMYRDVAKSLSRLNDIYEDILTEKYGLEDGRQRSNTTIAEKFRKKYYSEYGFTWNTARVSDEINEALKELFSKGELEKYAEKIKLFFK